MVRGKKNMVENPLDLWLCSFFTFFQINPLTYTKDSGCSSKIEFSFECNPFLPGTAQRLTWRYPWALVESISFCMGYITVQRKL